MDPNVGGTAGGEVRPDNLSLPVPRADLQPLPEVRMEGGLDLASRRQLSRREEFNVSSALERNLQSSGSFMTGRELDCVGDAQGTGAGRLGVGSETEHLLCSGTAAKCGQPPPEPACKAEPPKPPNARSCCGESLPEPACKAEPPKPPNARSCCGEPLPELRADLQPPEARMEGGFDLESRRQLARRLEASDSSALERPLYISGNIGAGPELSEGGKGDGVFSLVARTSLPALDNVKLAEGSEVPFRPKGDDGEADRSDNVPFGVEKRRSGKGSAVLAGRSLPLRLDSTAGHACRSGQGMLAGSTLALRAGQGMLAGSTLPMLAGQGMLGGRMTLALRLASTRFLLLA